MGGSVAEEEEVDAIRTAALIIMGAPIHWVSKKHQHVGESSAEDEYMALNHASKMVVWLRNLFKEMGLGEIVSTPTLMLGDNKQACRWILILLMASPPVLLSTISSGPAPCSFAKPRSSSAASGSYMYASTEYI